MPPPWTAVLPVIVLWLISRLPFDHVDAATLEGMASGDRAVVDLDVAADDVDAAHDRHVVDDQVAAHVIDGHARAIDDRQAAGSRPIEGHSSR